jgi:predicted O-linked N-acetylglucosamine transferase (SPINDLY family)
VVPALLGGTVASPLVLTCIGILSFLSRFSGSLLRPRGMPEMVTLSPRVPAL